jgi:hypothetical protein
MRLRDQVLDRTMWPTPTQAEGKGGPYGHRGGGVNLRTAVDMWQTPVAGDGTKHGPNTKYAGGNLTLFAAVEQFPTPTSSMVTESDLDQARYAWGGGNRPKYRKGGGTLNPDWVELLMGWPKGWTSLMPLEAAEMRGWPPDWEEGVPRVAKSVPGRAARLKAIGNGQVPAAMVMAVAALGGGNTGRDVVCERS